MASYLVNKSESERLHKQKQASIIRDLASGAGAQVTHRGGTWWEITHHGKTWKVRGASNVIRSLELLAK